MDEHHAPGLEGIDAAELPIDEEVSLGDPSDDMDVEDLPIDEEITLGSPDDDRS